MKRGRPKLPKGEKREVFALRLSPAERDAIERAAHVAGLGPSEWARKVLTEAVNGLGVIT